MPTIRNGAGSTTYQQPISQINNRFMFTGREWAPVNLGFYEYRARAYHPGLGRFTSEDPKGFDAGDYNLFRYCHNDPEDLTDPMGLESVPPGIPPPPPRLKPTAFTSLILEGPGTQGAAVVTRHGTDTAKVHFSPEPGSANVGTATSAEIQSMGDSRGVAITVVKDKDIVTAAVENRSGGIDVTQTVTARTYLLANSKVPKGNEKVDPASRLGQELIRIQGYRDAAHVAGLKAQALAQQGFRDRQSAVQAVEQSTRALLRGATIDMRIQHDLYHGTDPGY